MADSAAQDQWLEKIVAQLHARDGVTHEVLEDGRIALTLLYNGATRDLILAEYAGDFRAQKIQYSRLRESLTALGITEGAAYVAPKRSRKPPSPEMIAARAKQRTEFDAWQEVWRTIRLAEQALDVDYEIAQMKDYY